MVKLSTKQHSTTNTTAAIMTTIPTTRMTGISCLLMLFFAQMLAHTNAQRPSFAGSRPTGGLNQKDKYHSTTIEGVANRFGDANDSVNTVNQLPFGAVQRPPVFGPIVIPQPQYVPLNNANQAGTPQITVDNRINGNDIGGGNIPAAAGGVGSFGGQPGFSNVPPQFQPRPQPVAPLPVVTGALPLDAHGDQALIDYLNTVPLDQRPFWFLNYQAIEAQRNSTKPTFTGAVGSPGSFFG